MPAVWAASPARASMTTPSKSNPAYGYIHRRLIRGGGFATVEKVSQSLLPAGSKDNPIMFSGGVYVGEHTSQAASVGSVRQGRTDPARSGLRSPLVGKGFAFFDKLTAASSEAAVFFCRRGIPLFPGAKCGIIIRIFDSIHMISNVRRRRVCESPTQSTTPLWTGPACG